MKRSTPILLVMAAMTIYDVAQPAPSEPSLSTAERTSLGLLQQQLQNLQQQMVQTQNQEVAIEREFSTNHPGFHVNPMTFAVERDAPPTKPSTPPSPAKKP